MKIVTSAPASIRCDRIILHFDFDSFYASCIERQDPKLKSLPLAIQQKQIIVTCNYEARRRGLYKLQLISEARRVCPEVVVVLGEDLTPFRNASKDLHKFLAAFSWNSKYERLGFDEAWLDCTDMVNHNVALLNYQNLKESFFQLDRRDPHGGFPYDASVTVGHVFPFQTDSINARGLNDIDVDQLELRLRVASHLAAFLRGKLNDEKGFTATAGISVNKLLSKVVGTLNRPNSQTILLPPYATSSPAMDSNVNDLLDCLEIGKIPGIGFKISQKLKESILRGASNVQDNVGSESFKQPVNVRDARKHPRMNPESLGSLFSGPGWRKDIGYQVFGLLNGIDDSEVSIARSVPEQISIEDSYLRLDTMDHVHEELLKLSRSLLRRMRLDLVDTTREDHSYSTEDESSGRNPESGDHHESRDQLQWIAVPRTLRLSTRPRLPKNPDGTRLRSLNRISRSGPLPSFAISSNSIEEIPFRLVTEALIPMFKKLHSARSEWDLSLINVAVTHIQAMAGDDRAAQGRDISQMFATKEEAPSEGKLWKATARPKESKDFSIEVLPESMASESLQSPGGLEDNIRLTQESSELESNWDSEEDMLHFKNLCSLCGATMPDFQVALDAHLRFHLDPG